MSNGRRFVRWSPEELALWLKDGARAREVLLSDRLPEDAHVVGVRDDPDNPGGLLVFLDSREWPLERQRNPDHWRRLELEVQWGRPPDPSRALDRCSDYFVADQAYHDHVETCTHCDQFRRCDTGADLGVVRLTARERAVDDLVALKVVPKGS